MSRISQDAEMAPHLGQILEIQKLTPPLPGGTLRFDPFLARGMDYYTGPIFEIAAEGVPFSLAGGGRFDELIEKLGGPKVPACGFSIGFERIFLLMEERGMFSGLTRAADILIVVPQLEAGAAAQAMGAKLRVDGLRVDVYPGVAKLPQQFELGEKKGIPFALLANQDEWSKGMFNENHVQSRPTLPVCVYLFLCWSPQEARRADVRLLIFYSIIL